MFCEEEGYFLEIVDIVRGFGLIIFKGVMEVRDDKIWVYFVVEVYNRCKINGIVMGFVLKLKYVDCFMDVLGDVGK